MISYDLKFDLEILENWNIGMRI